MTDPLPAAALAVSDSDLDALVRALRDGVLSAPLTRTGLQAAGFEHLVTVLEPYADLDPDALGLLLGTVLAERRARRGPVVKVVWSGEDGHVSRARYTVVVVPELFARARRHVLLAGYSFDRGAELFAPLHAAMRDHGVTVDLFLDLGQLEDTLDRECRRAAGDGSPLLSAARRARDAGDAPAHAATLLELFLHCPRVVKTLRRPGNGLWKRLVSGVPRSSSASRASALRATPAASLDPAAEPWLAAVYRRRECPAPRERDARSRVLDAVVMRPAEVVPASPCAPRRAS